VLSAEFQELTLWSAVGTLSRRSQSVVEIVVDLHRKGVREISGTGVGCRSASGVKDLKRLICKRDRASA